MTKSEEMQSLSYIHQVLKGTEGHVAQSNKIEVKYLLYQKKKSILEHQLSKFGFVLDCIWMSSIYVPMNLILF